MTAGTAGAPVALERLADELNSDGFAVVLVTGTGHRPCLAVADRATLVTEAVYADDDGWFWWPWAERIATTDDLAAATYRVSIALRGIASEQGQR